MTDWILDRLKERSTWLGFTSFLTAAGVAVSPDTAETIIAAGLAMAGLVAAVAREK